ncbi:MAG: 2-dehydropantoate 2-reductase, partial [SAR202 cluster bacterium]|nr:2-dehydropantoate 2-reductase [SAR202 cluster bacterium]
MRVAIVGAGAIGGYFGAQLIKAGHSVNFVTRGVTADSLKVNGLELQTDA